MAEVKDPKGKSNQEYRNHLQWHVLEEQLAVIADTSRLSNQTHNQTGILSTCQCNDKIHMVFNKLKRKSYKSIYTINLRTETKEMDSMSD